MKIASARYDPETGVSTVVIKSGDKTYTGSTMLAEEDADIASSFAGCQFAELKARKLMLKDTLAAEKKKLKTLKNLYLQITQLKEYEEYQHSQPCRFIRKSIRMQETKVKNLQQEIETITDSYPVYVEERLNIAKEIPGRVKSFRQHLKNQKEMEEY